MKRKRIKIAGSLAFVLFWIGCIQNNTFDRYEHISDEGWKRNELKHFTPNITDTLCSYHVEISVRHDSRYPFKNLWILFSYPNDADSVVTDTLNCILSNPRGNWVGEGLTTNEVRISPEHPIRFGRSGLKQLTLEQACSKEAIKGITDVGIRLRKITDIPTESTSIDNL